MKVLFVSNDPKIFDPASAVRARLRAYAAALGEAHVVSAGPVGVREESDGPLHLHPVHGRGLTRFKALVWKARGIIRKEGIEVVSAQDPFEYGLVAWKAALFTGARLHIQLHTDPFALGFVRTSFANRIRRLIMPFVLRRAVRIRVVSERLKRDIESRYHPRAPVSVLPIYADLGRFRSIVRAPEKGSLLWIGRLEREKDPMLAVEALAAARSAGIDARLTMLGGGRLEAALKAKAKALGIEPYIGFPGFADPLPYLARAELLLATSEYEGYGLAIIEALAADVPVLSTDVGIAREAGAVIASREEYVPALVHLLGHGPPAPPSFAPPYASFADYVAAYAEDVTACAR